MRILNILVCLLCLGNVVMAQTDMDGLSYQELDSLMGVAYGQRNYEKASSYMEAGWIRAESEFGKTDSITINYYGNLGFFYDQMGLYDKAEVVYLDVIERSKSSLGEGHKEHSTLLVNLANVYSKMGRYEEAEDLFLKGMKHRKEHYGEEHPKYTKTLNLLAHMYAQSGEFEQAEPLHLRNLAIKEKTIGKQNVSYARSLSNLAVLYSDMERHKEAVAAQAEAVKIKKEVLGGMHTEYALSLLNLASTYRRMGQVPKAIPLYFEAKEIIGKLLGKDSDYYATTLNNLAIAYSDIGKHELAKTLYFEVLQTKRKLWGTQHPNYSFALNNIAFFFINTNVLDSAFAYCMSGVAANSTNFKKVFPNLFGDNEENFHPRFCCEKMNPEDFLKLSKLNFINASRTDWSLKTLIKITKLQYDELKKNAAPQEEQKNKILENYNICKAAMYLNEGIRNNFSGISDKQRILKENYLYLKFGLSAVSELDNPVFYSEAFAFAEQNKSILLSDAIKGDRARVLGDLPDSLVSKELRLKKEKVSLKYKKSKTKNKELLADIAEQEVKLNTQIDLFLNSIKGKYPKYHALKYKNVTVKAEDVQTLLDEESLLLEYFTEDTITYLFAVTHEDIKIFPLSIKKTQLSPKIKNFHNILSNYKYLIKNEDKAYQNYIKLAHWFYEEMLKVALEEDVNSKKAIKNLIIVADGELGQLPFETFLVEPGTQGKNDYKVLHYLVNDYNVSYNYSATLWKENLKTENSLEPTSRGSFKSGEILACAARYTLDSNSVKRLPEFQKMRGFLNPLPAAQKEIQDLSEFLEGDFWAGQACNEADFKANASNYSIIHLAMHGLLNSRIPMASSLVFTENNDSTEDNFLQAFEISRMRLNADLVVLSACETGYGRFQQGEGILSLARSFMYAGVPSLVVSLWQVNDNSTSILMNSFYHNLREGMAKDVALRQAKMNYIKSVTGVIAHPAFWSPFIQLGDSRPIEIATKKGWLLWGLGAGVLALVLIGGFLSRKK